MHSTATATKLLLTRTVHYSQGPLKVLSRFLSRSKYSPSSALKVLSRWCFPRSKKYSQGSKCNSQGTVLTLKVLSRFNKVHLTVIKYSQGALKVGFGGLFGS